MTYEDFEFYCAAVGEEEMLEMFSDWGFWTGLWEEPWGVVWC